mmetsp:Transcript_64135/g.150336  ORF Transcript_64135/g.150336 Transcript_64135/m.150336 type:complete len:126 (+) Transcript_64135:359-736(+)
MGSGATCSSNFDRWFMPRFKMASAERICKIIATVASPKMNKVRSQARLAVAATKGDGPVRKSQSCAAVMASDTPGLAFITGSSVTSSPLDPAAMYDEPSSSMAWLSDMAKNAFYKARGAALNEFL